MQKTADHTQAPWFFAPDLALQDRVSLSPEESRHAMQVLRLSPGDAVVLCNGRGRIALAHVKESRKNQVTAEVKEHRAPEPNPIPICCWIAPPRNAARWEVFLEKSAELGLGCIQPLDTEYAHRSHVNWERSQKILISAMKQSQKPWATILNKPLPLSAWEEFMAGEKQVFPELTLKNNSDALQDQVYRHQGFMAHCRAGGPRTSLVQAIHEELAVVKSGTKKESMPTWTRIVHLFVGPEGDFSASEVDWARQTGLVHVHLGPERLRTETAGILAVALANLALGRMDYAN